jgi:hypothetical protein
VIRPGVVEGVTTASRRLSVRMNGVSFAGLDQNIVSSVALLSRELA